MSNAKTIYCISTNSATLARASWVLQRSNRVLCFNDTETALKQIEQNRPDLVIIDTSAPEIDVERLTSATKQRCSRCTPYVLITESARRPFSSLYQCNCIVGQVNLPLIPEQLSSAVNHGFELSQMCKIRSNVFRMPLPADQIELVMQA